MMFRRTDGLEVLLVHPGGPFFANRDAGSWTIPKGEVDGDEEPLVAARREFVEETGLEVPGDGFISLGSVRQKGGKEVLAWAFEGNCDPETIRSNTFELEWPPRSGRRREFPEIDRAAFFAPDEAKAKLNPAQVAFLERLRNAGGF